MRGRWQLNLSDSKNDVASSEKTMTNHLNARTDYSQNTRKTKLYLKSTISNFWLTIKIQKNQYLISSDTTIIIKRKILYVCASWSYYWQCNDYLKILTVSICVIWSCCFAVWIQIRIYGSLKINFPRHMSPLNEGSVAIKFEWLQKWCCVVGEDHDESSKCADRLLSKYPENKALSEKHY
jgi:hypothetical protein